MTQRCQAVTQLHRAEADPRLVLLFPNFLVDRGGAAGGILQRGWMDGTAGMGGVWWECGARLLPALSRGFGQEREGWGGIREEGDAQGPLLTARSMGIQHREGCGGVEKEFI